KIALINSYYEANVTPKDQMKIGAYLLTSQEFKNRVLKKDKSVINELAKIDESRNNYSFATKFVAWHYMCWQDEDMSKMMIEKSWINDTYPIYDKYVHFSIRQICSEYYAYGYENQKCPQRNLRNYGMFIEAISKVRDVCALGDMDLKKLDQGLWVWGREIEKDEKEKRRMSKKP
ncbi:MAG: hypothetical protein Q7J68_06370, partial [Thermoplasmata archaeon]|nr:hypothetical protein [Thermoplasmata archaeon]